MVASSALDSSIRSAIAEDPTAATALSTNRHSTETPPEPVHLLRAVTEGTTTRVVFQIFRELVWPVYFPNVTLEEEQTLYRAFVTTGSEFRSRNRSEPQLTPGQLTRGCTGLTGRRPDPGTGCCSVESEYCCALVLRRGAESVDRDFLVAPPVRRHDDPAADEHR
jgi:hypothetical protein